VLPACLESGSRLPGQAGSRSSVVPRPDLEANPPLLQDSDTRVYCHGSPTARTSRLLISFPSLYASIADRACCRDHGLSRQDAGRAVRVVRFLSDLRCGVPTRPVRHGGEETHRVGSETMRAIVRNAGSSAAWFRYRTLREVPIIDMTFGRLHYYTERSDEVSVLALRGAWKGDEPSLGDIK